MDLKKATQDINGKIRESIFFSFTQAKRVTLKFGKQEDDIEIDGSSSSTVSEHEEDEDDLPKEDSVISEESSFVSESS